MLWAFIACGCPISICFAITSLLLENSLSHYHALRETVSGMIPYMIDDTGLVITDEHGAIWRKGYTHGAAT
jgi:hypothetical protein